MTEYKKLQSINNPSGGEVIVYVGEDGKLRVDVTLKTKQFGLARLS